MADLATLPLFVLKVDPFNQMAPWYQIPSPFAFRPDPAYMLFIDIVWLGSL